MRYRLLFGLMLPVQADITIGKQDFPRSDSRIPTG